MRLHRRTFGYLTIAAVGVLLAGCIVSGTFVVSEVILGDEFTTSDNFYYRAVDITDNETWQDHVEDIQSIDVVGFEMWIKNRSGLATTFDVWVDDIDSAAQTTLAGVREHATQIIDGLEIKADSANFVTYGKSLSVLTNTKTLKALLRTGRFHYYGYSSVGGGAAEYDIDSIRVIVTLSASGT